jgi:hypothetical protein
MVSPRAVVAQTAFNPVIMMELIAAGVWQGSGIKTPEFFAAGPFCAVWSQPDFLRP